MSVIMTLRVKGDPEKLEQLADADRGRIRAISDRAKEAGMIAHRFYGSEGQIMVVDESPRTPRASSASSRASAPIVWDEKSRASAADCISKMDSTLDGRTKLVRTAKAMTLRTDNPRRPCFCPACPLLTGKLFGQISQTLHCIVTSLVLLSGSIRCLNRDFMSSFSLRSAAVPHLSPSIGEPQVSYASRVRRLAGDDNESAPSNSLRGSLAALLGCKRGRIGQDQCSCFARSAETQCSITITTGHDQGSELTQPTRADSRICIFDGIEDEAMSELSWQHKIVHLHVRRLLS